MTHAVGRHLLIEMYDCDPQALNDIGSIESAMLDAASCYGITVIHPFFHRFSPQGVSGVIVIAESHMSIHTWPELRYAAVDLFTCGNGMMSRLCLDRLSGAIGCRRLSVRNLERGGEIAGKLISSPAAGPDGYLPLHPEIFRYDSSFVARFIAPEVAAPQASEIKRMVEEAAEQIYLFRLFTPEFCRLLIEESEHRGGWVTVLEKTEEEHPTLEGIADLIEPDTTLSWEFLPGMPDVYAQVIEKHVRPVLETLWGTFKLQRWDMPAVRKFEPHVVRAMDLHYDNEIVGMIGYLNTEFTGGGTFFPRWNLTIGRSGDILPGTVAVYPGGVSHEHLALPVTAGPRYMLSNSFY